LADVKISGLPASTTPLAGTEVLPIVQGGQTRQVSVNNLTTGKSVSATNFIPSGSTIPTNGMYLPAANTVAFSTNSTEDMRLYASGGVSIGNTTDPGASVLSITTVGKVASLIVTDTDIFGANIKLTGNGATTPSKTIRASGGNFEVVNSGYGGVPLSLTDAGNLTVTGNFVVGTSGKGIDFSATPGTGTSELLADYEEGTFNATVTSATGSITSYTAPGTYVKVGKTVTVQLTINITSAGTAAGLLNFANLPFTSQNVLNYVYVGSTRENNISGAIASFLVNANATAGTILSSAWASGQSYSLAATYITA
jgi:hypothetical protein